MKLYKSRKYHRYLDSSCVQYARHKQHQLHHVLQSCSCQSLQLLTVSCHLSGQPEPYSKFPAAAAKHLTQPVTITPSIKTFNSNLLNISILIFWKILAIVLELSSIKRSFPNLCN